MNEEATVYRREHAREERLRACLSERGLSLDPICFATVDSTNTEAKRMVASGHSRAALLSACAQSAGRGRMGRSFYSPSETGAYFSLLYPVASLRDAVTVTCAASVAVMRAVCALLGVQTQIKWVNDLYLGEKKVCGILTESVCGEGGTFVIVGIGINLSTRDFPQELCRIAGSLNASASVREELIAEVCAHLLRFLGNAEEREWLEDYRMHSCVLGKTVTWTRDGHPYAGVATRIDEDGALWVDREDGIRERIFTGEISIKLQ